MISCFIGYDEVVPTVRHDMIKQHWEAAGRLLFFGLRIGYFSIKLSFAFLVSTIFGEDNLKDATIDEFEKDDSNDGSLKDELNAESACFNHLTRFIKSLSKDKLLIFLRFVTYWF